MNENLLSATTAPKITYDALCNQRRYLEQEIALQGEVLAQVVQQVITPHNIVKAVSGVVFDNITNGFSLVNVMGQGIHWLRIAKRFIKRFM